MKTGFLSNINKMDEKYKYYQEKLDNDLNMIDETLISKEKKDQLKRKYRDTSSEIYQEGTKLESKLDKSQETISRKIKPIYIFVAIISLFILFLGGQEVKHGVFPLETMNSIVILSGISIVGFYLLSFSKYELTVVAISLILVISIVVSTFAPFLDILKKEYIVNMAFIIAYSPFFISLISLFISTARLELNHRKKYRLVMKEVAELNNNIKQMSKSKNFINEL